MNRACAINPLCHPYDTDLVISTYMYTALEFCGATWGIYQKSAIKKALRIELSQTRLSSV